MSAISSFIIIILIIHLHHHLLHTPTESSHLSEAAYQTSLGLLLLRSLFVPLSGSLLYNNYNSWAPYRRCCLPLIDDQPQAQKLNKKPKLAISIKCVVPHPTLKRLLHEQKMWAHLVIVAFLHAVKIHGFCHIRQVILWRISDCSTFCCLLLAFAWSIASRTCHSSEAFFLAHIKLALAYS